MHHQRLVYLTAVLLTLAMSQALYAYNTTVYTVTVKNNTEFKMRMQLGDGVGSNEGQCVHANTTELKNVSIESGHSFTFSMAFKGGDQFYLPDGNDGSYGVPLGCLKGNKGSETSISFDYYVNTSRHAFGHVLMEDYSDSGDLMRCSAITNGLNYGYATPGTMVMGCSADEGSESKQSVTVYINTLPEYHRKPQ